VRARLPAADLHRAVALAPGAARDGSTRVVARARALALPLDEDPAAASAPPGRQPRPRRPRAPRAPAGASAARRPARRRRSRLLTAVLALLVLLGAGTWAALDGPLDRVTVPSVARASEDDARLALRQHHLQPAVSQRYDDAVPAGSVVTTVPRPGASVRENSAVRLVVSRGPQLFPVPALAGKTRTAAEAAVRAAHLAVGTVAEDWSETVPTGSVVTQEASGQALRRGSAVSFTVSRGREPIDLPALPGTPQAEAARRLTGAGLQVGAVTTEASDTVPAGQVVRSSPGTGPLHRGDAVALVVSSGPAQVAVPHVVGQRLDDARRALQAAGFTVEVDAVFGGFLGVVQGQSPDGGQAKRGSTVTLSVF
jgi:serine/threonine-protein kinase